MASGNCSKLFRKIIGRRVKKKKANLSTPLPPLQATTPRNDGRDSSSPRPMNEQIPVLDPILPDLQRISPMNLPSPLETEGHYFFRPASPGRTTQGHAGGVHLRVWSLIYEVHYDNTNQPAHFPGEELVHDQGSSSQDRAPSPKPMMSDASFYLLPEYTGSSDEEEWPSDDDDDDYEIIERGHMFEQSLSLSSSSSGHQQLAPLEPPSMGSVNDRSPYELDSSPVHHTEAYPTSYRWNNTLTPTHNYGYNRAESSTARISNSSENHQNPTRPGTATQPWPSSVLLQGLRHASDSIPHCLVPERSSSIGATSVHQNLSPGLHNTHSSERLQKGLPYISSQHEPVDGLASKSSSPPGSLTRRHGFYNSRSRALNMPSMSRDSTVLPPVNPGFSPLPMVSLPPSELDQIFNSPGPNDVPRVPRIFLGNSAPRVPQIFRQGLLTMPPQSTFDPNDRLPRDMGVMNLRDDQAITQQPELPASEESSVLSRPVEAGGEPHARSDGAQHRREGPRGVHGNLPRHDRTLEDLSHSDEHLEYAHGSENDTGRDSGAEFMNWIRHNRQFELDSDPYDRSGAQNRSMMYDSE